MRTLVPAILLLLGSCSVASEEPLPAAPESAAPVQAEARPLELGPGPPPTEHWLDPDAEAEEKLRRKAWFGEIHRAPDGVDWKALERANGLAQIAKRNQLARQAPPLFASPWVERGSQNLAGRMHVAAYSTDGTKLYAGSSKGGVWKGNPDGTDWTPIGDNLAGGAHWLTVVSGANPGAPDVVLAATDGGQVHVSTDDGASWLVPAGLPGLSNVRRVLVASDGSETVFLVGREGSNHKLFRSTDGLASFQFVRGFAGYGGDVWMPRDGGSELLFVGSGNIDWSSDYGDTWTNAGAGLGGNDVEVCGSEAGAPRLWGVFNRNGSNELHRSDDAGASWTYLRDVTDYWGSLNASITDVDVFAYGGVEVWRTTDAGGTFAKVNNWYDYYGNEEDRLHADIPGIDVWPGGPHGDRWFVSTDGGLYVSEDGLATVDNLSLKGLRVSQYYSTHTSSQNPRHVIAGAQDQGYQWTDVLPEPDTTTIDFDQLISGDYGHLTSGDGTHEWVFSTYPGFILAHKGEDAPQLFQVSFPDGESNAWLPPVVASNLNRRNFYFCATRIWKYQKNVGVDTWSRSLWSQQNFQASSGEYVSAFTFSPVDPQRAYAATNRGRLFWSNDRGQTWTQSASTGPNAHYFYGTAIEASIVDADTVYVGGSGYGVPAVYRSTDGGQTFQAWGDGLPNTLVYCLGEAPDGSGTMFCGTETAAYMRTSAGASWLDVTSNVAPVTIYWSVEPLPDENTMRFGTYGRGIWDYQLEAQARCVAQNGGGTNATCFACALAPELGGTFEVRVDSSGHPGATVAGFVLYDRPSQGSYLSGSEVLVDLAGSRLLQAFAPATGAVEAFAYPVPNDPALTGIVSYAQGYLLGGAGLELCNRLEVVLGE